MADIDDPDLSRAAWRKSTYSNNGGQCVEVAVWRKSTYSNNGGECVEVTGDLPDIVTVRDSKNPTGPKLTFAPEHWKAFTAAMRATQP
jgi:hypothetical protein